MWDPAYLIVRDEGDGGDVLQLRASVLTGGDKAGIVSGVAELERGRLDAQLRRIETNRFHFRGLDEFGTQLAQLVLTPDVTAVLGSMKERRLVVVQDAASSRVPWETLRLEDRFPALSAGMSRRYMADNLSVAKWLEQRRHDDQLDLMLVVNPTQDLEGAEEEGKRIAELFGTHSRVRIHEIRGPAARKAVLAEAVSSGRYDVLHYAGHAFFDAANPARSSILCAGGERLRGEELANLGNLPSLVFFNACEAGRVRRLEDTDAPAIQARITVNVGLAEAFLRGGVANYVGTYWPVGDAPAKVFAETFYTGLLDAIPIGQALLAARQAVAKLQSVDWADYIHYGDPGFVLKGID